MKDTKASLEIIAHGDVYAIELHRRDEGTISIGVYCNSFMTTELPPGIALAFAEWQRSSIPRLCCHTKLARDLVLADAAGLMVKAQERFR